MAYHTGQSRCRTLQVALGSVALEHRSNNRICYCNHWPTRPYKILYALSSLCVILFFIILQTHWPSFCSMIMPQFFSLSQCLCTSYFFCLEHVFLQTFTWLPLQRLDVNSCVTSRESSWSYHPVFQYPIAFIFKWKSYSLVYLSATLTYFSPQNEASCGRGFFHLFTPTSLAPRKIM